KRGEGTGVSDPTRPGPTHLGGGADVPRMLACWSSSSFSCCSRSMAMINGTTSMRNVVPAIQAALPVLFMSFLVTNAASFAACLPRTTTWDCENFAITPSSSFLGFRLSGREMPPFRAWAAIGERERETGLGSGWMDCEFTLGKEEGLESGLCNESLTSAKRHVDGFLFYDLEL
ncbi:unnamed protein product, partial [Prunus brigantina]